MYHILSRRNTMGFQNSINNMLGTAGAAATLGKHIKNQNKAIEEQKNATAVQEKNKEIGKANLELKFAEQQEEAYKAEQALNANSLEISKKMQKDLDPDVAGNPDLDEDSYLELKQKKAGELAAAEMKAFSERKLAYEMGAQKAKPSSKNLDKANQAFMEAKDAVMARRQLKFDLEAAKKRMGITQKALEGVK